MTTMPAKHCSSKRVRNPALLDADTLPRNSPPGSYALGNIAVGDNVQVIALYPVVGEHLGHDPLWLRVVRIVARGLSTPYNLSGPPLVMEGRLIEGGRFVGLPAGCLVRFSHKAVLQIATPP